MIRADNLRGIPLFEADFKFSNKLYFGIRLTKREKISGVLPQEQRDLRSGHMPIEEVVPRIIFFGYFI